MDLVKNFTNHEQMKIDKGLTYTGKSIKDFQRNMKVYIVGEKEELVVKSDDELFIIVEFINVNSEIIGFHVKKV